MGFTVIIPIYNVHQEGYWTIFRISLSDFAAVETEFRPFSALSVDDLEQQFAVKAISVLELSS